MDWIECTEEYVLSAMPSEVRGAYDKWLVVYPIKSGRLGKLVGQVVADFRSGLAANPNMVLEDGDDLLPEQCVTHATTIMYYHLMLEMGVAVNMSAQTAFSSAQVYLRRLYTSEALVAGVAMSRTPSYKAAVRRQSRTVSGV